MPGKRKIFKAGGERNIMLTSRITETAGKQLEEIVKHMAAENDGASKADAVEKCIDLYHNQLKNKTAQPAFQKEKSEIKQIVNLHSEEPPVKIHGTEKFFSPNNYKGKENTAFYEAMDFITEKIIKGETYEMMSDPLISSLRNNYAKPSDPIYYSITDNSIWVNQIGSNKGKNKSKQVCYRFPLENVYSATYYREIEQMRKFQPFPGHKYNIGDIMDCKRNGVERVWIYAIYSNPNEYMVSPTANLKDCFGVDEDDPSLTYICSETIDKIKTFIRKPSLEFKKWMNSLKSEKKIIMEPTDHVFKFNKKGNCEDPEIAFSYKNGKLHYILKLGSKDGNWAWGVDIKYDSANTGAGGTLCAVSEYRMHHKTREKAIIQGCLYIIERLDGFKKHGLITDKDYEIVNKNLAQVKSEK